MYIDTEMFVSDCTPIWHKYMYIYIIPQVMTIMHRHGVEYEHASILCEVSVCARARVRALASFFASEREPTNAPAAGVAR